MLTNLDLAVLVLYLFGVIIFGLVAGRGQRDATDYFVGGRDLPWWAVCFSIVATETSTLTVIGIPAVAYLGGLAFFQLTIGYVLGRTIVALFFIPRYFEGSMISAYQFLGGRFGNAMRASAGVTFLATRLLADGVRLFASAIPLKVIAVSAGWDLSYFQIIAIVGVATIIYTYLGGIKAVVWMDVVQMVVYVGGAIGTVAVLATMTPVDWWSSVVDAGKSEIFFWGSDLSFSRWLTEPYTFITAVVGGAIFSLASHGTDQLIVQRLLACRSLQDSQRALIASGFIVMFQFALFLLVGLLLWIYYDQSTLAALGLTRGDEVFPKFIIEGLPPGVSGLLLAGILAAAMSTLSSSLNALASSTVVDLYERITQKETKPEAALRTSRLFTLFWGLVFIGFAGLFQDQQNPVVELGLAIASFTYGGLLGSFLLGLINERVKQREALIAFGVTIAAMVWVIFGVWYSTTTETWILIVNPSDVVKADLGLRGIGWPWYTAIGALLTVSLGSVLAGIRSRFNSSDTL